MLSFTQIAGGCDRSASVTGIRTRPRVDWRTNRGFSSHLATGVGLDAGQRRRT